MSTESSQWRKFLQPVVTGLVARAGAADFTSTVPQLSIYMPSELRNNLAVGDELCIKGDIYVVPFRRTSLT